MTGWGSEEKAYEMETPDGESFLDKSTCKNCKHYVSQVLKGGERLYDEGKKFCCETQRGGNAKPDQHCMSWEAHMDEGKLKEAYLNIVDLLKKYCDLKEEDYPIIATWIVGTYFHSSFESYPYLFLNAMKGSGKTRTLKLISDLSWEGEIIIQPTEAVLFRTKGTLGIDEAEGMTRKGMETIRELLNGCYKSGTKVKRMRQQKTPDGTQQVVEEFEIYRPLTLANINGMEDVLGDRCINIILERSNNPRIVKLAEIWQQEEIFIKTKKLLNQCRLCSVVAPRKLYVEWNEYIDTTYTPHTNNTNDTNNTHLFKSLNSMDLTGREVELSLPLLFISHSIGKDVYVTTQNSIKNYMIERKADQFEESRDIMLIDMIAQEPTDDWFTTKDVLAKFLNFTQEDNSDGELNARWIGKALKRLNLIKDKKRLSGGRRYKFNVTKAQAQIKQFK